ncbi:MAG: iron chelate uptake ABC transporter family permease subunit [Oscillospiraceae bacterium]
MKNIALIIVVLILSILSIFIGVATIDVSEIWIAGSISNKIIFLSRLPRTISIVVSGFGISICGLIMQQITMNKFVSPSTAGTSDGAKLGVLIALLVFPTSGVLFKMVLSVIFALISTFLFVKIIQDFKGRNTVLVPFVGLILGGIISSITTFFAYKSDLIQNVNSFLFGNFSSVMSGNYELLYLSIPFVVFAFIYANKFTIVGLGEDITTNLGLSYQSIVRIGFIIVCTVSALIMVTIGSIPFLGLVVPNLVTMFLGDNLAKNSLLTGLSGSVFLLLCDLFGRLIIFPHELPIGMVVGVIGSGVFLVMIMRRNKFAKS